MCGFCGFINFSSQNEENLNIKNLKKILSSIHFRGPDRSEIWHEQNKIFLGHNRLSILDLSENGNQPMISHNKRFVLVYNGEIYNHLNLRKDMQIKKNIYWKGNSDTETILEYISLFGLEKSLEDFQGMFSFALFDKTLNKLYLARDTMGEKPLYYGFNSDLFYFGSDIKSFLKSDNFCPLINYNSVSSFLQFGFIAEPSSILQNIHKLEKSSYLELNLKSKKLLINKFLFKNKKNYISFNFQSRKETLSELENLLFKSVESQLISDVGVGTFLSGGIDSTLITCIANSISSKKINTFSIGFENPEYDESAKSREISNVLKTNHYENIIKTKDIDEIILEVSNAFSEPFADSSQIPTLLLSKFSSNYNKVVLTGDGADEIFGGYNRYSFVNYYSKYIKKIPLNLRKKLSHILMCKGSKYFLILLKVINFFLKKNKQTEIDNRLDKFFDFISAKNEDELYFYLLRNNSNFKEVINLTPKIEQSCKEQNTLQGSWASEFMRRDQENYLNNDILVKLDRSSMYYSLEARAPFLDQDIINFSMSLPMKFKVHNGEKKYILKELLKKILPSYNLNYPKKGFSIPLNTLLKKDSLKKIVFDLLNQDRFYEDNYLNKNHVLNIYKEHLSNKRNNSFIIWNLFNYFAWREKYKIY